MIVPPPPALEGHSVVPPPSALEGHSVVPPPPALDDLRAGYQLVAGKGRSTILPDMDFETYSEAGFVWLPDLEGWPDLEGVDGGKWTCLPDAAQGKKGLTVVGAARYSEHPTTEVLSLAYDLKEGVSKGLWRPGDPPPLLLFDFFAQGGVMEAWNVGFERYIWENVCVKRMGWPAVDPRQWRCAMAKARAWSLPGKLANAGAVLAVSRQKDKDGERLLNKFSIPRNPTKADRRLRIRPEEDAEDGPRLYGYNQQDLVAESEISALCPDQDPDELEWWLTDQEINHRGIAVDMASVENFYVIVKQALEQYERQLHGLTGGVVETASQIERLRVWLGAQGVHVASLDEEAVTEALARPDLPPVARQALEIRARVGSSSVKKLYAIRNQVCADNRLRDLFTYHGAHTGRTTGNGPQPTNLPSSGPDVHRCGSCGRHFGLSAHDCPWCGKRESAAEVQWCPEAAEDVYEVAETRSLAAVELFFGDAFPVLAGSLRGLLVAEPSKRLVASDYSAIEAVTLAMLAGEKWREEVFRTHGLIYETSASKMFGTPLEVILQYKKDTGQHHPLRKKGKTGELAFGYGGWIGAARAFGADGTDEEIKQMILSWRAASPAIVEFWGGQTRKLPTGQWVPELYGLEGAAVRAVADPGSIQCVGGIQYQMAGDALYCKLLSGRNITYHRPRLAASTRRSGELQLSYEGWNTNPKRGKVGWIRMETYAGKLTENINQATARDIQRFSLVQLEKAGYPIVQHVYDENCAEVPDGFGSLEEFERIMSTMPAWAAGWPIKAKGGYEGRRYRK